MPNHARLQHRQDDAYTARVNRGKLAIVHPHLKEDMTFVEFGPGDCRFAMEVAKRVRTTYGIDISDQRDPAHITPRNFNLIIYDGYDLIAIADGSIDLVFSDQLIEHFHPEDTQLHFQTVHRILKNGGKYVFRTPNYLSGPHDISRFFSDEPEGFHLKEWTFSELKPILFDVGFREIRAYRKIGTMVFRLPYSYYEIAERLLSRFPKSKVRLISRVFLGSIIIAAIK